MRLVWVTARDLSSDLAATTEISLCRAMASSGVDICLISPGKVANKSFEHHEVKRLRLAGLNTLSGAWDIRKRILADSGLVERADIVLVDWRYIKPLEVYLRSLAVPWLVIDRGPPATSGLRGGRIQREFLRNLQKRYWSRGWRIASSHSSGGFVVSSEHKKLVNSITRGNLELFVLPAGTESNQFIVEKTDPTIQLKLIYIGRIDKKRGVEDIIRLSDTLADYSINHLLTVVGTGDMENEMAMNDKRSEFFHYQPKVPREKIQEILAANHIGILPMPDIPIWRISSPLKLAEYLAAGLLIVGPEHPGNQLNGGEDWSLLTPSGDWVTDAAGRIKRVIEEDWRGLSSSAVESSKNLQWENISKKVFSIIEGIVRS